ncbi:peptidoglycan-binding protein [Gemmata massiliana]|uniref:peptidoglycan-binding protein n=1 Tax=Gemmata massiliana TaxID=1210884 RepID=UPI001E4D6C80|nr:peptidoglycan-binding protein [Gemmata massiliana]
MQVEVEDRPDFDANQITVRVDGKTTPGAALAKQLITHDGNIWTEEVFPPGDYTVEAQANIPEEAHGLEAVTVQAGQTATVQILLKAGGAIAKAFVVHFRFDNAFVEPNARPVLKGVASHAQKHPDEKLLIVGHTDLAGSPEYNQSLAERRARAVYAFLTYQQDNNAAVAEWDQLRQRRPGGQLPSVHDNWGTLEYQKILQDLDLYKMQIHGTDDDATKNAVKAFQQQKGIPATGVVDSNTWGALIRAYLELSNNLGVDAARFFPNGPGQVVKWLGCGEQDPVLNTQDAWRPNRRVECLFVRAEKIPTQVPEPDTFQLPTSQGQWNLGPGNPNQRNSFSTRTQPESGKWLIRPAEPKTIVAKGRITLVDGQPYANANYVLVASDGEYMDGERPNGPQRGTPLSGATQADGTFAYPDNPKNVGVFRLDVGGPFFSWLAEEDATKSKGLNVWKRLDGTSEFNVVLQPQQQGITLHDIFGKVRANTEVTIDFPVATPPQSQQQVATDTNGTFQLQIATPLAEVDITYASNEGGDELSRRYFLDPRDLQTDAGVHARLHNLGYNAGANAESAEFKEAVLAFQAAQGLDTTGEVDNPTRDRLQAVFIGAEPIDSLQTLPPRIISEDELLADGPPRD